ncbi:MAG: hypothetical protein U0587_17580 [Candidatus Binatia bacterium]
MYAELLGDATLYEILLRIDEDLAAQARAAGCACGGRLHSAVYPRKPRGAPMALGEEYDWRQSFCCEVDGCRRRTTPPSVRFLGRKVYLGAVVVLVSALRQGPSPTRVRVLHELFGVGERTLRRWRQWWQTIFVESSFWRAARGRLVPSIAAQEMPRALAERFGVQAGDGLVRLLRFLSPSTTASCVLAGGGF